MKDPDNKMVLKWGKYEWENGPCSRESNRGMGLGGNGRM